MAHLEQGILSLLRAGFEGLGGVDDGDRHESDGEVSVDDMSPSITGMLYSSSNNILAMETHWITKSKHTYYKYPR